MELPKESRELDALVRASHEQFRDDCFWWLVFFTIIVGAGVLMELIEHLPIRKAYFDPNRGLVVRHRLATWIRRGSWISTAVVALGIAGEGVFEFLTSRADSIIGTFNEIELGEAERQAGRANERVAWAHKDAAEARFLASKNEKEAAVLRYRAAKAEEKLTAVVHIMQWRFPSDAFVQALKGKPAGKIHILFHPEDNPEVSMFAMALWIVLKDAGWIVDGINGPIPVPMNPALGSLPTVPDADAILFLDVPLVSIRNGLWSGVRVYTRSIKAIEEKHPLPSAFVTLLGAFRAGKLSLQMQSHSKLPEEEIVMLVGPRNEAPRN